MDFQRTIFGCLRPISGARIAKRNFNAITAMICAYEANSVMAACQTICYSAASLFIKSAYFYEDKA
jgi:hypothetical protein